MRARFLHLVFSHEAQQPERGSKLKILPHHVVEVMILAPVNLLAVPLNLRRSHYSMSFEVKCLQEESCDLVRVVLKFGLNISI